MVGKVHIMGIVNLTPDSFYAGSRVGADDALQRMQALLSAGADVLDLGACSTRPGSLQPSLEEEWTRLEPVLLQLRSASRVDAGASCGCGWCISIDTYRAEIVRRVYDTIGPFIANDISGGQMDPEMLETVGTLGLPYVAMHMRGTPENMQQFTDYNDVVASVIDYFHAFSRKAQAAGIREWMLDPGFGFSKTLEQNYQLLERLNEVSAAFPQQKMLVGLSRKSMAYKLLGIGPEEALPATQVLQFAALERGATWLRVHDVAEAVHTATLFAKLHSA